MIEFFSNLLLDAAHPADRCSDTTSQATITKQRCVAHFQNKRTFMDLYCVSSLDYGPAPTELHVVDVREAHARKVQEAGEAYVKTLRVLYPECQAFYPHAMARHCADDIREHGCPIFYVQEADEAKNLETKNMLARQTNHQLEHRLLTIMKTYNMLDSIVDKELATDSQLGRMLERKAAQKSNWNDTRQKTSRVRTVGKLADLQSSVEETTNTEALVTVFNDKQAVRLKETLKAAADGRKTSKQKKTV